MLYRLSVKVSTKIIEMYLWEAQYVQQLSIKVIGIKCMIDGMTVYHYSAEHKMHQGGTLPAAASLSRTGLRLMLGQCVCCSPFQPSRGYWGSVLPVLNSPGTGPQHYNRKVLTDQALKTPLCNSSSAKQT